MIGGFFKSKLRKEYEQLKAKVSMKLAEREVLHANKNDVVIISQPDGSIMRVNKKCLEVLGYSEKELYNKNYWTMIHPEDLKKTEEVVNSTIATKSPVINFVCRVADAHGQWVKMAFHTQTGDKGILYTKATVLK